MLPCGAPRLPGQRSPLHLTNVAGVPAALIFVKSHVRYIKAQLTSPWLTVLQEIKSQGSH